MMFAECHKTQVFMALRRIVVAHDRHGRSELQIGLGPIGIIREYEDMEFAESVQKYRLRHSVVFRYMSGAEIMLAI